MTAQEKRVLFFIEQGKKATKFIQIVQNLISGKGFTIAYRKLHNKKICPKCGLENCKEYYI